MQIVDGLRTRYAPSARSSITSSALLNQRVYPYQSPSTAKCPVSSWRWLDLRHVLSGNKSHTIWANGNLFNSGMTTALTPNAKVIVPGSGRTPGIRHHRREEGGLIYAALTADSYHPGVSS